MEEKEQYAFISYSSKNQQMADSVRMLFIEKSIPCWMAPYDIPAGSKYAYVINDALENCACLVLLLTNASQASQFVEREIERAITYNKPIIPMQLEDIELNSGFKFYIGNSQIIAVPEIYADSPQFRKVMESVCKFVGCEESLLRDNREECHDNGILHRVKQCRQIYTKWDVHSDGESSKEDSIIQLFSKFDPSVKCTLRVRTLIQKKGKIAELSPDEKRIYENELTHIKSEIESGLCLLDSMKVNSNIVQILETIFFEWEQDNQFGCDLLIRHESLNSLRTQISTGASFPEDEVIKIGKDISLALNGFHKMNVIHGDIKPENIFVNQYGAYKLGYFDFANQLQHIDKRNIQQIRYTSTYVAPEQISGPYYDKRVDIYSLGLVLYELANNNHLPFISSSYVSVEEMENAMRKRLHGAVLPTPSHVSERLATVILKACTYRADDRYQTAQAFLEALNNLPLQSQPTVAGPRISEADQVIVENAHATQKAIPKHSQYDTTYAGNHKSSNSTVAAIPSVSPHKNKSVLPVTICIGILIVAGLVWALIGGTNQSGNDSTLANDAESISVGTKEASTENSVLPATSNDSNVALQGISIEALPEKTTYYVGESLDTNGMKVNAEYSDGTNQIIYSNLSVSPSTFSTLGNQTITVSYNGYSTTFTVVVEEPFEGPVREITWKEINAGSTYDGAKKLSGFLLQCMFTCEPHNEDGFTVANSFGGEGGHKPFFVDGAGYGYMYFSFWIPNDPTLEGWHSVTLYYDGTSETVEFYLDFVGDYSHILGTPDSVTGLGWSVSEWKVVE